MNLIKYFFNSLRSSIITVSASLLIFFVLLIIHLEANLPSVEILRDVQLQVPLKIYSADGKLIAEYGEKRRTPITLDQVPEKFIQAIISTEDCRFYSHFGVDMRGLIRAAVSLVTRGTKEQGGSTITMQVARNFFLTRKKTFTRKINEILLALKIEQELSKNEILELYLNKIYLGKRAYGIAAAAEVYYGTTIDKLTLAQMATIAGLPQAPSAINPIASPKASIKRRTHVLSRMLNYNFITQVEFNSAVDEPVTAYYHGRLIELEAAYIAELARQKVVEKYGEAAYEHGLEVITTVDSKHQIAANQAFRRAIFEYDQRHGYRKPIQRLATSDNVNDETTLAAWHVKLQHIPKVNALLPAAVTHIEDESFQALTQHNEVVQVTWDNMKWARLITAKGELAPPPQTTKDIVKLGDVVYLDQVNKQWKLSQAPEISGAIVAMDTKDGAIKALIGGVDYEQSLFNRATQAERQPGSAFKPFVYSIALESGFTPASIINDAPIVQEDPASNIDWRPQNYNKKFYGPTRLRTGLIFSRNLVSIRLLKEIGIDNAIDRLEQMGFARSNLPPGLSLALGANHITPLNLTAGFCIFPNGGFKVESYLIKEILNYQGNLIFKHQPLIACSDCKKKIPEEQQAPRVISTQTAYLMSSLLQDAVKSGTGRRALSLGRKDLAGKTGTTNDQFDVWYAGFNKDLAVTTWLGFDEPKTIKEYAGTAALPMWMYFLEKALKGKPDSLPQQPPGLVTVKIDPATGLLASPGQADAVYETFVAGSEPKQFAAKQDSNDDTINNNEAEKDNVEALF